MTTSRTASLLALTLLTVLATASPGLAASLTRIEVRPTVVPLGTPIEVTVFKSGSQSCGFQVQTGEGRLGPFGLPGASKLVSHTYTGPGRFEVRVSGAPHGRKPACGGSPATVTVEVRDVRIRIEEAVGPIPILRSVTPSPAIVGQPVTIEGSDFGEPGEMELVFGNYAGRGGPLTTPEVRSWSSTRIVVAPPFAGTGTHFFTLRPPPPPLSPGGATLTASTRESSINFEVAMPRPTLTGYRPANVCPGSTLEIQGRGFTELRGGFTILWNKVGRGGMTIREDRIQSWSDRAIQLRVPTDTPGYVSPGDEYQIQLGVRTDGILSVVATGPRGRLGEPCGPGPSVRIPGVSPSIGTKHALGFRLAPVNRRVAIGENVVFGGTYETPSRELATRLRSRPLKMNWRIVREGEVMGRGTTTLKGRRTPLLVRAKATKAGTYRLELEPIDRPADVNFRTNLDEAWVEIIQLQRLKPGVELQKKTPLPKNLPKPNLKPSFDP